jgi:hypothetical protein
MLQLEVWALMQRVWTLTPQASILTLKAFLQLLMDQLLTLKVKRELLLALPLT